MPQYSHALQFRAARNRGGNPRLGGAVRAQAVRFNKPSQANEAAFDRAVDDVADAARRLLASLQTSAPARDRDVEAAKARERARERFA